MAMTSTFGGFNTVVSGLAAQQLNINTAGHNVSNASTDGYSRQRVNLVTTTPEQIYTGYGASFVGTGVTTQSITRARDFLVDTQYWRQNATKSYYQDQTDTLGKVENIFSDTKTTGLQSAINTFYTALGTLANNADDSAARTVVREDANALVQVMQTDGKSLVSLANDVTSQIDTQVKQLNSITTQIADLNKQIVTQEVGGAKANDLRDKRDSLVDQLSSLTSVYVKEEPSGSYTVSIAGGMSLVQGDSATALATTDSNSSPYNYTTSSVTTVYGSIPVTFKDGSIAALTQLRDQTIGGSTGFLKKLDNIAQFLMQDFNTQHKQGVDNNGNPGDNFFGVSGANYTSGGASDPTIQIPPQSWLSALTVNSAFYTPNGYNLIAARDNAVSSGTADGVNATAMANLLKDKPASASAAIGNNSLTDYYGSMVSTLGVQSQQAINMNKNQGTILAATTNSREAVSGVSMDEELANIIKYQQAYGACAKVMTTMDSMLDTLINKTSVG